MRDLLQFSAPVEIQAVAGDAKRPTFRAVAYDGGPMRVAGYGSVVVDLRGADVAGVVPLLESHGEALDNIVGQGTAKIEGNTIVVAGQLTEATPSGAKVIALARSGIALQASIGFAPEKREHIRAGDSVSVNGKTIAAPGDGLTIIRSGRLREVSLVPVGANAGTQVQIAATAAQQKQKGIQKMTVETINIEALDELKFAWERPGLTDSERVLARWNGARFTEPSIREQTEKFLHAALAGSLDFPAFEREILKAENRDLRLAAIRAERPQAPAIHASTRDGGELPLQAAFAVSCGLQNPEKHYAPEVLEAADRNHRGIGLQEILVRAAQQNGGYSGGRMAITAGNCREILRAAFSTHSLTTMLSTAGNKLLLDGFGAIPQPWREVAAIRPVRDFKAITAYRMNASLEYEELAPTNKIKHGTLSQETYELQAKTYAKMMTLTRADIINDDLGAFNDLRTRLGMGAAAKMNKVFWTAWLAARNAGTFWTEARGNLVTSAALAEAGLNAAVKAFRVMPAPDGDVMTLEPNRILVPADLEATALKLYASQEVRDTTSSTKTLVGNIYFNRFRPVVVPELSNAAFTGYSATTWWLLADPRIIASAAMCFLDGQESPTIESADADFDELGIQFRGYHDFGVSMSEYRAGVQANA